MNTGAKESLTILLQPWRMRAEQTEGGKSRRTGRAETRPRGVYQVLLFLSFLAGNWSPLERADGSKEEGRRLIVMLNLRVNDTITMPTPAIAMETIFIASTG